MNQQPEKSLEEILEELEQLAYTLSSPGWKKFAEDTAKQLEFDKENAPTTQQTNDQWQYFRGHCAAIQKMVNLEEITGNHIQMVKEAIYQRDNPLEDEDSGEETPL